MDKDLKVLAECVDIRNGKRFKPGEFFDPAPTTEQAERLVAAKCLPEGAIAVAKKAQAAADKKAEEDAKAREAADKKAQELAAATTAVEAAKKALTEAEATAAAATDDAAKAAAGKALAEAKAAVTKAEADLAKLAK